MSKTALAAPDGDSNEYINRFNQLIQEGQKCWMDAGKILADAVDRVPGFINKLIDANPIFTRQFLNRMLDLGRGALHPKLLLGASTGERKLSALPYSWQEQYVDNPIVVLVKKDSGLDELRVDVRNLTPDQCNQVFCENGVRTLEQQRAFLESSWAKKIAPPTKGNLPYRIVGKKLVVMQPTQFDRRELAKLLSEMES